MLGYVLIGIVVVLLLVYLFNRRAFSDFFGAVNAQVGKLGAAARNADPQAVIHQEIRNSQAELDRAVGDLEESQGLVAQLSAQVAEDAREVSKCDAKVRHSLTDDPEDKGGKAANYVMQLETAQSAQQRNSEQLQTAKTIYANNLEKFRLAQRKIEEAKNRANNLGVELQSSQTNAKLANLAKKFNVDVGGLDSVLGEAEKETRRQIAKNNAVGVVQTDLGMDGLAEAREEERLKKAEASAKLEEYRKKMGLQKA